MCAFKKLLAVAAGAGKGFQEAFGPAEVLSLVTSSPATM